MGACWVNKGDRLMVRALQENLGSKYYLPLPVYLNTPAARFWGPKNICLMFLQATLRALQYLQHGKPEFILDCSGYQYGDPWAAMGKALSVRLLLYQDFKHKGGKIVMLPQSLGPFSKRISASTAAAVFQLADLIFTRDETSRQYALKVGCPPSRIKIAPDYSNIVAPSKPAAPDEWRNRVCLVPSIRMLDKTSKKVSSLYLASLRGCVEWIRAHGMEPFLLVHDIEDRALIKALGRSISNGILTVDPSPLEAKGIIASCKALVGSRYHALVSALSQATPAIGTGWTHKYQALFQNYHCEEYLINKLESGSELTDALGLICAEANYPHLVEKLRTNSEKQLSATRLMFTELEHFIDGS